MTDEKTYESSDSVRSGAPLRHAKRATFDGPFDLAEGGSLPEVTVAYETYGTLNAAADNAVLVCHALSGNSHVARHDADDDPGWWDLVGMVGPGRPIDTDRYFVICPNILGGCSGTTGPNSINPQTARPYGSGFPTITVADMVDVQGMLIGHLGVGKLLGVIGGSMGGHQVLCWATRHPERVKGAIAMATSPRLTSQALAFDIVGRNAIQRDPSFRDGQYYDADAGPTTGLAIARMLGHITYLSRQAMKEKFEADRHSPRDVATEFEKRFSVGSYLAYQGAKFVEHFDANSYCKISMAMDLFDLGAPGAELRESVARSRCRWLVLSFTSDWLFPPDQSRELVEALIATGRQTTYCDVASDCGHDAFLLPDDFDRYGEMIGAFLRDCAGEPPLTGGDDVSDDVNGHRPTSIFTQRLDYDRIVELIGEGEGVLDLGCGGGGLLARLKQRGHEPLIGVELDERAILTCVRRGLNVIHADLDRGLSSFADGLFDCVVLSQTLQAVRDVEGVIRDMLRVGRRGIVSFPNFGYHKLRRMLVEQGRAPTTAGWLRHNWYDTPNIRFLTIADFEDFCREKGVRIHRRVALDTEQGAEVTDDPNVNADTAIFVISR